MLDCPLHLPRPAQYHLWKGELQFLERLPHSHLARIIRGLPNGFHMISKPVYQSNSVILCINSHNQQALGVRVGD